MAVDLLLASFSGSGRMQVSIPVESIKPLAGVGAFLPGVCNSAVEAHFLPAPSEPIAGRSARGLIVIQQRAHCEEGMEEEAARDIARLA